MNIDSIKNGIVIDHITAGSAMRLYQLLGLDTLNCSIAIIKNVPSKKMGKKDIIKIDSVIDLDLDVIGFVDPGATINIIRDSVRVDKRSVPMPKILTNVLRCKNPRCITSTEQGLDHVFRLADEKQKIYRCVYCDTKQS